MAYTGVQATIPFGQVGLLTDAAPSDIPPNAFITCRNISMEKGMVEKAPGTLRYNATPLPAGIVAIVDYWPNIATQRKFAATSAGNIYRDIGDRLFSGNVAIATGLGALDPNSFFIIGGQETALRPKKLFFFSSGLNQVKVLTDDGTTFNNIASPAADWTAGRYPKVGCLHRNRLWAFSGQFAYASNTGDHENFQSSALAGSIFPGEGGEVKGAFVFKGRLFAFKDGGFVYFLDDTDTSSANWFWRKISANFGLSAPHAVVDALDFMLAGNTTGTITNYSATDAFGDVEAQDLFRNANVENWVRENTSKSGLPFQHSVYYAEKKQAFFTYRSGYRTTNDMLLVLDAGRQDLRIYPWIKGTPECLALYRDSFGIDRPMYGDASGYINLMDYEDRLEGTASYSGEFQTPHLDFRFIDQSLAHKQKHFDFLSVEFVHGGNWNVTCDYYIDGKYYDSINFEQQIGDNYLNQFLLNTDYLAQSNSFNVTKPLKGTGRRISFKFRQAGANQSFQIASITVGLRPSGEQATKL